MRTVIRAISYAAGWVGGLFRRPPVQFIRVGDTLTVRCIFDIPKDGYDYAALLRSASEPAQADNDKAMTAYRAVSGKLEASRQCLADDYLGDVHDQIARGDG
jgi:hypothetical protein